MKHFTLPACMSEDGRGGEEYVILSDKPEDGEENISGTPVVVSGIALIIFTFIYMIFITTFPLGIILEPISNYVLEPQGMKVGFGDRLFGLRVLTSIYSAGLFFFLSDVLRAGSKTLSQYMPEGRLEDIERTRPQIWGNLLIFAIIVPLTVVVVTTFAASQFSNPEDLWEMMVAGYSGAIIGAYRQIASTLLPEY